MNIHERFEVVNGDYMKFELVENKRSQRPDLHALMLLDELFPSDNGGDMVAAAEHDEIWLDIDGEKLNALTDEQIADLVRCGVRHDEEHDCLCMFA